MIEKMNVSDLNDGAILARDLYINSSVLYKSGTYVTPTLIRDLKEKGVREVDVETHSSLNFNPLFLHTDEMDLHQSVALIERFQNDMSVIADELRYGSILHSEEAFRWIRSRYLRLFSNPTVKLLMDSMKQWDPVCYYHSIDVFVLCTLFFRHFGHHPSRDYVLGCLLHDIGKIYTPRFILLKKGKLTEREYELVKKHTTQGEALLRKLGFPEEVCRIARSHHERMNGSGYPDRLRVSEKNYSLKTIMLADVYSALTLARTYRKPMHATKAMRILLNDGASGLFDLLFCYRFIDFIRIYPPSSKVQLTDGRIGTVLNTPNGSDILPRIRFGRNRRVIQLPNDLSLKIEKMIGWDNRSAEIQRIQCWNDYIHQLIGNDPVQASELFDELSDGKRLEHIFVDIVERSINEICADLNEGSRRRVDLMLAVDTTLTVLSWKMYKLSQNLKTTMGSVVIAGFGASPCRLTMCMMRDLLAINGWKTYFIGVNADQDGIAELIREKKADYFVGCFKRDEDVFFVRSLFKALRSEHPGLVIMAHGVNRHPAKDLSDSRLLTSTNMAEFISNMNRFFPAEDSAHKKF